MKPNALTILEAHNRLIRKQITCVDLVRRCLEQIKIHDPTIKAFITVCADTALAEAKAVDEKIARGEKIGVLEGIPYAAKDVILTKDVRTTAGSNMLRNFVAPYDATVIKRLKTAGAILIGKTNCDAYGHGSSTENSDFFTTKNPWDISRVAGGSSGGSAAAVSADMCVFALGEDTGGSIRQPAAMCGVTGLKVSYGRVSRYGSIAYASSLDSIGPIGKSVEDVALVLECIAGHDKYDPTTLPKEVDSYRVLLKPVSFTLGVPKEYFTDELEPEIKKVISDSLSIFKQLNCRISAVSLPYSKYSLATYYILAPAETSTNLERLDGIRYGHRTEEFKDLDELYAKSRSEGFGPEVKRRIMVGTYALSAGHYDAYYKKAQKVRTLIVEDFKRVFKEVDLLISPTSPFTSFKVGEKIDNPLAMYLSDIYTIGFSLAGLPTISIPCGLIGELPVGLQITGPYFGELKVLQAAHAFQNQTSFHLKKSTLHHYA